MFQKVLIAEDHESINISVQKTLSDLGVVHDNRNYVFYCDDALMRIQKALRENEPYELLVTDLSFEEDVPGQKIKTGIELIKAAKHMQPDLKILVFSIENRASVANSLMKELGIDAYVPKARRDAQDLKLAIEAIAKNRRYLSPNLKRTINDESTYHFSASEIEIITLLSDGKSQQEISDYLRQKEAKSSSLSSIEKCLHHIRTSMNISKNAQLIAYCKDKGII